MSETTITNQDRADYARWKGEWRFENADAIASYMAAIPMNGKEAGWFSNMLRIFRSIEGEQR